MRRWRIPVIILCVAVIILSLFAWFWKGDFRCFTPQQALRSMEKRYLLPQDSAEICHYKIDSYRCYSGLGALNVDIYLMEKDGIYWHGDVCNFYGLKIGIDADVLPQYNGAYILPAYHETTNRQTEERQTYFYIITDDISRLDGIRVYGKPFENIEQHEGYYTAIVESENNVYETQDEFYNRLHDNITVN